MKMILSSTIDKTRDRYTNCKSAAVKSTEAILKEVEVLARFIFGRFNLKNLRYADDTVLIVDIKRKLQ